MPANSRWDLIRALKGYSERHHKKKKGETKQSTNRENKVLPYRAGPKLGKCPHMTDKSTDLYLNDPLSTAQDQKIHNHRKREM